VRHAGDRSGPKIGSIATDCKIYRFLLRKCRASPAALRLYPLQISKEFPFFSYGEQSAGAMLQCVVVIDCIKSLFVS
jgi:hypothetical protein